MSGLLVDDRLLVSTHLRKQYIMLQLYWWLEIGSEVQHSGGEADLSLDYCMLPNHYDTHGQSNRANRRPCTVVKCCCFARSCSHEESVRDTLKKIALSRSSLMGTSMEQKHESADVSGGRRHEESSNR